MGNDVSEALLAEIGQLLSLDAEYPNSNTLLYADLDYNVAGHAVFKELGNQVLYRWPEPFQLTYPILDLWNEQPEEGRWSEMEYVVRDGRFEVTYTYPDEVDSEEDYFDRRDRIVRKHFGDKPIVYPPWPSSDEDNDDPSAYEL